MNSFYFTNGYFCLFSLGCYFIPFQIMKYYKKLCKVIILVYKIFIFSKIYSKPMDILSNPFPIPLLVPQLNPTFKKLLLL